MSNDNDNDIIPAGIQIVCSRKNANKTGPERRGDAIVDPVQQKFYEALVAMRKADKEAGRKSKPMFRVALMHWDENGDVKETGISYQTLAPDQVAILHDIMATRMGPPKPKGRVAAGDKPGDKPDDGAGTGTTEGDDAAAAGDAGAAGNDDTEAKAAEAKAAEEKKAAAAKKKAADDEAAKKKAEADKKTTPPAANGNGAAKTAAEKAREAAAESEKAAKAAVAKASDAKAAEASGDDFAHLFDE